MIDSTIKLDEFSSTPIETSFEEIDYFEDDRLYGYKCEHCGYSFTTYFIKCKNYCDYCGAINRDGDIFRKKKAAKEIQEALKNEQG